MIIHSIHSSEKYWFGLPEELSPEIIQINNPNIPFKPDPMDFSQSKLSLTHIFQYLPKDHDCFVYADVFKELDYSPLHQNYSPIGQHAYNPGLISNILLYAYCHGVFSSRQIEKKCHTDLGFMYISHLNCPNFRVLSDFRKVNHDFFQNLFTQTLAIAQELDLVDLQNVCQDGSKFKADTSKHKAMSYGRMKKNVAELTELIRDLMKKIDEIEPSELNCESQKEYQSLKRELEFKETRLQKIHAAKAAIESRENILHPDEKIPEKSQISFADTDARIMGKNGNFDYCFNGQICVDKKDQIIVGQFLTQNANDKLEVEPALLNILWNNGRLPDSMSFDNGYFSGFNLESLAKYGVNAYVAVGREENQNSKKPEDGKKFFLKFDFIFSEEENVFICPEGQKLQLKFCDKEGKRTYSGNKDVCFNCKKRAICCKSKKGQPRTISTDDYEPLREEMREKMSDNRSKEVYARRKVIVEPVFGQIKNLGFKGFHMRGFDKAKGEFALVCSSHNLRKIVKHFLKAVSLGTKLGHLNVIQNISKNYSFNVIVGYLKKQMSVKRNSHVKIRGIITKLISSNFVNNIDVRYFGLTTINSRTAS